MGRILLDPNICETYLTMASGDNVCFSSLLTAWRRPCALELMSDSRAASSALSESKSPVNCGQRRKRRLKLMQIVMVRHAYRCQGGVHLVDSDFQGRPVHLWAALGLLG